ncbi:uncharacterized protein si:ch211-136m16.8 isoform X2 [Xyrauchen texanus]|uniref:uncharacterized protein si:ch211-136m16.8 isoform X2 n=1 Tax=Xyrauchen texanus TaxID=154827 RepID=UPI0022418AA6|nr:uncharacterized protein si:ch211-136m16.8 isoform X2 [Xyrauchen texanus]
MDGSENSGSSIIWIVWGYLSGAIARYFRPEVTDERNQNSVASKNTANEINEEENENEAEKKEGKKCYENEKNTEVKCLLPGASMQVASAQWENTDVVMNDHNELNVNNTEKQTHHCTLWSTGTDHGESVSGYVDNNGHKKKSGTITLDVQINNENEERQKSKACIEKEAVSSEASSEDNVGRKVSETEQEPEEIVDIEQMHDTNEDKKEECDHSVIKRRFDDVSKDVPEVKIEEENSPLTDWSTTVDLDVQALKDSSLDFSVQKSRIAVKNPLVRPPKDHRKLVFKASVEPSFLPKPQPCSLLKAGQGIAVSVPSKGVIGFKLPGKGAVMPALIKTEFGKKAKEEGEAESQMLGQEQVWQKSVAVKEDSVKQELASLKPKWTPPRHPGMGIPVMMAELKGKLKKPVKESYI